MMWHADGFRFVSFGSSDLPVSAVCVQCRENRFVSQQVDALFHGGNGIGIAHRYGLESSVVNTKSEVAVFVQEEDNRRGPSGLPRSDDFQLKHFWRFHSFLTLALSVHLEMEGSELVEYFPAMTPSYIGMLSFGSNGHPTWIWVPRKL